MSAASRRLKASCPICGKPTEAAFKPFCSKRCADVDLYRWLSGAYAIPAVEAEQDDGASAEPDPPLPN